MGYDYPFIVCSAEFEADAPVIAHRLVGSPNPEPLEGALAGYSLNAATRPTDSSSTMGVV
jgi:hypothetical protein